MHSPIHVGHEYRERKHPREYVVLATANAEKGIVRIDWYSEKEKSQIECWMSLPAFTCEYEYVGPVAP